MVDMLAEYGAHNSVPAEWDERLDGSNTYCSDRYEPETQLTDHRPESRYAFLNYCFATHGTFEIRVLPAFEDSMDLFDACKHIVAWSNKYIGENIDKPGNNFSEVISMDSFECPTNLKSKTTIHETSESMKAHKKRAKQRLLREQYERENR
jgi:hypothetical protein